MTIESLRVILQIEQRKRKRNRIFVFLLRFRTTTPRNGYLTVSAEKGLSKEEEGEKKYIRRERYAGSMSRSFYVGDHVTEEEIHPKYENGILSFCLPKEEKKEEKKHYISIEG